MDFTFPNVPNFPSVLKGLYKGTNKEVRKWIGVADGETQIGIQRIGWMQDVSKEPEEHEIYLNAMFGRFEFDEKVIPK